MKYCHQMKIKNSEHKRNSYERFEKKKKKTPFEWERKKEKWEMRRFLRKLRLQKRKVVLKLKGSFISKFFFLLQTLIWKHYLSLHCNENESLRNFPKPGRQLPTQQMQQLPPLPNCREELCPGLQLLVRELASWQQSSGARMKSIEDSVEKSGTCRELKRNQFDFIDEKSNNYLLMKNQTILFYWWKI